MMPFQGVGAHRERSLFWRSGFPITRRNEQIRDQLKQDLNADASAIDFLPFSDVDARVRRDLETIRANPLIPSDIPVRGFVYDVTTGRLREIV